MAPWFYGLVWVVPALTAAAFAWGGAWVFAPFLVAFVLVPLVEQWLPRTTRNLTAAQEERALKSRVYSALVYAVVPVQVAVVLVLAWHMGHAEAAWWERAGWVLSAGLCCGILGINVAHELGHRPRAHEQWMARVLLWTSLYGHFIVEHNRGHHRRVATGEDPASARRGQVLFPFIIASVVGGFASAWKIERERLHSRGLPAWRNEVAWTLLAQAVLCGVMFAVGGGAGLAAFAGAALIGVLLLETVNYVEHYGLSRRARADGRYERVMPWHSWNSSHALGRALLFDLTRHSDHHAWAARPYQVLRHHEEAPQLPAGYPGMMLLAWCPPLFFHVMHRQLDALPAREETHAPAALAAAA